MALITVTGCLGCCYGMLGTAHSVNYIILALSWCYVWRVRGCCWHHDYMVSYLCLLKVHLCLRTDAQYAPYFLSRSRSIGNWVWGSNRSKETCRWIRCIERCLLFLYYFLMFLIKQIQASFLKVIVHWWSSLAARGCGYCGGTPISEVILCLQKLFAVPSQV